MAVAVDVQTEGLRQLERAERLVELGSSGPRNRRTAVTWSHGGGFGQLDMGLSENRVYSQL